MGATRTTVAPFLILDRPLPSPTNAATLAAFHASKPTPGAIHMKLAVSTYSLSRWRPNDPPRTEEVIEWISKQEAVKAVEFVSLGRPESDAVDPIKRGQQLAKVAADHGLEVAGYCTGANLLQPKKQQAEVITELKKQVDIAAALGCKTMRHDVAPGFQAYPKFKNQTFNKACEYVAPAIREVADHAATVGVKTTLENHGFFMQGSKRVVKLIKTVKHDNFGLTIDMGNFLCVNEDPTEAVERAAPYAVMAHVKDFHVKPKKKAPAGWIMTPKPVALRGSIVGHGNVDVPKQLKLLKKAGYKSYLSLEFEGLEEPTLGVSKGLEFLREHMRALKILEE